MLFKTKKEKKGFSEIEMIALKFNRPKNWILSYFFSPVGLFKSLPAHTLPISNIEYKKTNDLVITKKEKKERFSEKEQNFELNNKKLLNESFLIC